MDAIYRRDGDLIVSSPLSAGPWDPSMQHGGAPSSLIAWAAEQVACETPMRISRLTIDLLRPVPVAPLEVVSEVIRQGRKIQVLSIRLLARGVEVARASVLKVRRMVIDAPEGVGAAPGPPPGPETGVAQAIGGGGNAFGAGFDIQAVEGAFGQSGPGKIWFRLRREVVADHAVSGAMRAAATADFSNGVGAVLDFNAWTYINGDLTVSLARDPVGEWILLDAETWVGPDGGGLAAGRLADRHGYFGRAAQSLVIEPRT
jgi:hypothetical protein